MTLAMAPPDETDLQFRLLVEGMTDYAIFRLDKDGFVTSWNAGAQHSTGYASEEIIGRNYSVFFTQQDRNNRKPAEILASTKANGRFLDEEWRIRKDGSRFCASIVLNSIYDQNGQITGFLNISRDMTEKRSNEEALRESERRSRLLVDSLTKYAIFTLDPSGLVTSWNTGAEKTTGYSREAILGRPYTIFFRPQDQASQLPAQILAETIEKGRFEDDSWAVRKDGTRFHAHVVLDPLRDQDGKFIGFILIIHDVTMKWALEEAEEQLRQAKKMETLGQLTGGVTHDFNNLLSAVMGSLELILHKSNEDQVIRIAEAALRAVEGGGKLTHQLLAFARKQVLQPQLSNINDLIMAFDHLLKRVGGEAIKLNFQLTPEPWLCNIDQAHFQSALLNLVVNARDAMPGRGVITITTKNISVNSSPESQLTEIEPGSYVMVTVQDTGMGMTPDVKARAIEPFFTTKDVGQGSGLGLSQVYKFIQQSKGQIDIESEPGNGASVSLYLPKAAEAQPVAIPAAHSSNYNFQGITLIVEDDSVARAVAVEAFESFGYTVYTARDGFEALSILQKIPQINLLFTDVVMPNGMNGVRLAQDARRLYPQIRVLLASGYPREALQANEGLDESMAFIAKPYTFSSLKEKLAAVAPETLTRH